MEGSLTAPLVEYRVVLKVLVQLVMKPAFLTRRFIAVFTETHPSYMTHRVWTALNCDIPANGVTHNSAAVRKVFPV
jgi:hypothetical protein